MSGNFFENRNDSASVEKKRKIAEKQQPKTMDEMMQMFRQQIQEMEKQHQKFFEENRKHREF